jgi:folate-binding protein YgfZ
MVTNKVQDLDANEGAWNLVLNSQGRIQGDLEVWRGDEGASSAGVAADELEIQIESAQIERLMAHLDKYIIMDDVELIPVEGMSAIGLFGPMTEKVLGAVGIATTEILTQKLFAWNGREVLVRRAFSTIVPRYELWIESDAQDELRKALGAAGAMPVGFGAAEMLRIVEGIPRYGVEMVERDLPQESSQMRALHFSKGCYQGQEIVERIHSRANVHRHLRQVEFLGAVPVAGCALKWKDAEAGVVRSAVKVGERIFGLAMIRADAEVPDAVLEFDAEENKIGEARLLSGPPELSELS